MNTDPLRRRAIVALIAVNLLWGISFPVMKATNMIMGTAAAGERDGMVSLALESNIGPRAGVEGKDRAAHLGEASLARSISDHALSAAFLTIVRFAISFVLLCISVPRLFHGMTQSQWLMGIWTGLVFAPGFIMQNVGLNYVPASRSGFLTSLCVVSTPLVMIVLERRLPRLLVVCGIIIGLIGTAILTGLIKIGGPLQVVLAKDAFSQLGPGDWLTITAALIFTAQILLIDRFSRRMPAGRLTPGMFVATFAVGLAVFAVVHGLHLSPHDRNVWVGLLVDVRFLALILVMSVFCTVLAFHWMNKYQGHVTPAQAALIYTTEPIFATGWAMFLPALISLLCGIDYASERPGRELLIGGLIIVLGNALALWPARRTES